MADFYAARSRIIPPLPWTSFAPPFSHPLFVFNQFGDLERCALRPGNVHSADGWEDVLRPVLARYSSDTRPSITRRYFRGENAGAIIPH